MLRSGRSLATTSTLVVVLLGLAVAACAEDAPAGDTSAARGAEVYERYCASCHGDDLRGATTGPPLLTELYAPDRYTDEALRRSITAGAPQQHWGFGPMPMVGGVRGSDLDAVIAFVREQQAIGPLEPFPPG